MPENEGSYQKHQPLEQHAGLGYVSEQTTPASKEPIRMPLSSVGTIKPLKSPKIVTDARENIRSYALKRKINLGNP